MCARVRNNKNRGHEFKNSSHNIVPQKMNKLMCKKTSVICFLLFLYPVFTLLGQQLDPEYGKKLMVYLTTHTLSNTELLYQKLSRNLSAYMIHQYASDAYNPPSINSFFFDEILNNAFPPCDKIGSEFNIRLYKSAIELPHKSEFIVLEYTWTNMETRFKIGDEYRIATIVGPHYNSPYSPLMEKGLIAVSSDSSYVVFISGYTFLNNICHWYFPDNQFTDAAIHDYISVRYYNYTPIIEKIDVEKQECLFFSRVMQKRYRAVFVRPTDERSTHDKIYDRLEELSDNIMNTENEGSVK